VEILGHTPIVQGGIFALSMVKFVECRERSETHSGTFATAGVSRGRD
jgi:hypothetical protein